jgi:TfoX/Sxy family transcriptional regulator of competence genes
VATTQAFVEYICEQIRNTGDIRYKKMFGEYMVYVNDKPIFLVCGNTVFVKRLPEIAERMADAETGYPYEGAKEHYVLDVDDAPLVREIVSILEPITPLPKPRKKKGSA